MAKLDMDSFLDLFRLVLDFRFVLPKYVRKMPREKRKIYQKTYRLLP